MSFKKGAVKHLFENSVYETQKNWHAFREF
jgi:hypothetical protein